MTHENEHSPPNQTSGDGQLPQAGATPEAVEPPATPVNPDAPARDRFATSSPSQLRLSAMSRQSIAKQPPTRPRAWLIVPVAIAGLLAAAMIVWLVPRESPHTVSEVTRQIQEIVLRTSDRPGVEDGGPFGPLWIAARDADPLTGKLTDVRVRAGQVRLAARTGMIMVDAQANTIGFSLHQVVIMRVPEETNSGDLGKPMMELDTYVLGPVPYRRRIIEDGHPAGDRALPEHIAGVSID